MKVEPGIYQFRIKYTKTDGELNVEYTQGIINDRVELCEIRDKLTNYIESIYPGCTDLEIRWGLLSDNGGRDV